MAAAALRHLDAGEGVIGVVGASARAAAASIRRAGMQAWAVDLFGDRDLLRIAASRRCPFEDYPHGLVELASQFPPGPFLYTGGLENHPDTIARLAESRPLLGNPPAVLAKVRDPFWLGEVLAGHGLAVPGVAPGSSPIPSGRWVRKSLRSSGGLGVRFARDGETSGYLQEFIEGRAVAAVFSSDERTATLLGITEQLIGEEWLHSHGFHYCGSVGPIAADAVMREKVERIGRVLHESAGLRGLWGIDCILRGDEPFPVEVNPRYTASVEVLELAHRCSAIAEPAEFREAKRVVGKAILFAPRTFAFPVHGPWDRDLDVEFDPRRIVEYADIPAAGELIEETRPVLTFFAGADTVEECQARLKQRARLLENIMNPALPQGRTSP